MIAGHENLARVELEDPLAQARKLVLDQEVVERRLVGNDPLQQGAQSRNVPLPLLQLVNPLADHIRLGIPEHRNEVPACGCDP